MYVGFGTFEVLLIMIFEILNNNMIHTPLSNPKRLSTEMTTNESNGNLFADFGQTQNINDILQEK